MELPAYIEFFLAFGLASAELGPVDSWTSEFRRMCNLLLEPYMVGTRQKHPFIMRKTFFFLEAWVRIADNFALVFQKGYETGTATTMDDALFCPERQGYPKVTCYSIYTIPFGTSNSHMAL